MVWRKHFTFLVLVFLFVKGGWKPWYAHWCSMFPAHKIYPKTQESSQIVVYFHLLSGYQPWQRLSNSSVTQLYAKACFSQCMTPLNVAHWWKGPPYNSYLLPLNTCCGFRISPLQREMRGRKSHSSISSHPARGKKITKACAIFSLHNCCRRFSV